MGIFDTIKDFEIACPKCGEIVKNFQTKDGEPYMRQVDFRTVNKFYSGCQKCKTWIEFKLKEKEYEKRTIDDYEMVYK